MTKQLPALSPGDARYDTKVVMAILERLASGETLTAITKEARQPSRATFNRWVVQYPDVARAYRAARELSAQAFEDEALALAHWLVHKDEDGKHHDFTGTLVRAYEVAMAQLRWSASRRDPANYGQTVNQSLIVPIQITTTLDMGEANAGDGRNTKEFPDIYKIEARVVPDLPDQVDPPAVFVDPLDIPDAPDKEVGRGKKSGRKFKQRLNHKPSTPKQDTSSLTKGDPDLDPE